MRKQPQKYTALKHKAHVMYKVRPTGTTLNWEGKVVTVLLKGQKGNNEGWAGTRAKLEDCTSSALTSINHYHINFDTLV